VRAGTRTLCAAGLVALASFKCRCSSPRACSACALQEAACAKHRHAAEPGRQAASSNPPRSAGASSGYSCRHSACAQAGKGAAVLLWLEEAAVCAGHGHLHLSYRCGVRPGVRARAALKRGLNSWSHCAIQGPRGGARAACVHSTPCHSRHATRSHNRESHNRELQPSSPSAAQRPHHPSQKTCPAQGHLVGMQTAQPPARQGRRRRHGGRVPPAAAPTAVAPAAHSSFT